MRTALVAINARYTHTNPAVRYLQNCAAGGGFASEIFEFTISTPPDEMLTRLSPVNFDVICISVYIWNAAQASRLAQDIRKVNPAALIVLGGPEVSWAAEEWLASAAEPDFIVKGAGEAAFLYLLEKNFAHDEKIVSVPNPPFEKIPSPYPAGINPTDAGRYIYYESSRGCPFRCAYCLSAAGGQSLEFKSAAMVRDELSVIIASRPMAVKFVDRTFNAPAERAREIWEFLLECGTGDTVFHFEINPALITGDDISLLKRVPRGKFRFEIGVQSLNSESLKAVNRAASWDMAEPFVREIISETNVRVHLDLIAGLPFENEKSFAGGFNRLFSLRPAHLQPGILKMLPGTPIREAAEQFGIKFDKAPPYSVRSNLWLTEDELTVIKQAGDMTEKIYNSGRFTLTVENLLARFASPWEMFLALAESALPGTGESARANGMEIISAMTGKFFPDDMSFFTDCLRWDWMCRSPEARYPRVLKQENLSALRKNIFTLAANGEIILPENRLPHPGSLKIFFPESEMFQSMYMEGKGAAVFGIPGSLPVLV